MDGMQGTVLSLISRKLNIYIYTSIEYYILIELILLHCRLLIHLTPPPFQGLSTQKSEGDRTHRPGPDFTGHLDSALHPDSARAPRPRGSLRGGGIRNRWVTIEGMTKLDGTCFGLLESHFCLHQKVYILFMIIKNHHESINIRYIYIYITIYIYNMKPLDCGTNGPRTQA